MTRVVLDVETYVTREVDPDDSWDNGDRDGHVNGVYIADEKRHFGWREEETDLEPPFFVVYAEYSTGSTFGRDFDATIVTITKDESEAQEIVEVGTKTKKFSFEVRGKVYSADWIGYFEHLRNLTYERLA